MSEPGAPNTASRRSPIARLQLRRFVARTTWGAWLIAAIALVASLTARPGKMPADTKLYLYLDPARLVSDASLTWDIRQFGGWVPHQVIAYLWPSGPWFWTFDRLGIPDWVAHRLWIAALVTAAGLGVRWAARLLGLTLGAATAAGMVYAFSPYILPYVSRTSAMLLPWAGLGWLVGFTVRAATRHRWRDAGAFALVVFTIGAVNATALALVAPAPVLWLAHAAWERRITWRRAVSTACRLGGLSLAVSAWWIAMLVVQGRHGADVLAFSEALADVSRTAVGTEVLRGLGYWLFYVRDPYAATTSASIDHLTDLTVVAAGYAVTVLGIAGVATVRWSQRRFAALLVAVGVILAVGVHPIEDPSPLMAPLAESGLGLALRSSTRALPLALLGIALGVGALVGALQHRAITRPHRLVCPLAGAAPALVLLLVLLNMPALFDGRLVDRALERDQDVPAAWRDAVRALDEPSGFGAASETRVLQIPGSEFGAFRWGYTVDPPLPGLADTPLVTRDLLPLGSAGAMDLLYAFDDRIQNGVLEPASVAPVARLLAADTVWLANDLAFDRFRTPRPEPFAAALRDGVPGLGPTIAFGAPEPNAPDVAMVDEEALSDPLVGSPIAPVELLPVLDPVPVLRLADRGVVVVGSGDGLVDAAAAGLIDGDELVWYSADLQRTGLAVDDVEATMLVITDSNRDRARHWRSSQDTTGFTETGGPEADLTRPAVGDTRLEPFGPVDADQQTVALLAPAGAAPGSLRVRASAYGEPYALRPEHRAAMAVDGDVDTAWLVADRADPVGESITVEPWSGRLTLLQSQDPAATRRIERIRVDHAEASIDVVLDERSWSPPGQVVDVPETVRGGALSITITAVGDRPEGSDSGPTGVGFAELGPVAAEVVRLPRLPAMSDDLRATLPVAVIMTRDRVSATDRWRDDPEPVIRRLVEMPASRDYDVSVTMRLDRRSGDTAIAALTGSEPAATTADRLLGVPAAGAAAAFDGDPTTAWVTPFGSAAGASATIAAEPGSQSERLTVTQRTGSTWSTVTRVSLTAGGTTTEVTLPPPDADGTSTAVLERPLVVGPDGTVGLTVTGVDERLTIDRRHGEPTGLPAAIVDIDGIATTDLAGGAVAGNGDGTCRDDLLSIDGSPVSLRFDADIRSRLAAGEAVVTSTCDGAAIPISSGDRHVLAGAADGLDASAIDIDRVVLSAGDVDAARRLASSTPLSVDRSRSTRTVVVPPCSNDCWVVLGEGYNDAWQATVTTSSGGRTDLGQPLQVSGGFNGWRLSPSDEPRAVEMRWSPQRGLDRALAVALVGLLGAVVVTVRGRRARAAAAPDAIDAPEFGGFMAPTSRIGAAGVAAAFVAGSAVVVRPAMALPALVVAAIVVAVRRPALLGLAATLLTAALAVLVWRRVWLYRPVPDASWPSGFADLSHLAVWVVVLLLAGVAADPRSRPT